MRKQITRTRAISEAKRKRVERKLQRKFPTADISVRVGERIRILFNHRSNLEEERIRDAIDEVLRTVQ